MMNQERQKKVVLTAAFCGTMFLIVYLSVKILLPPLMPFILGFLIALLLHRPSAFLAKKLHLTQKLPAALLTAVFYILAIIIILFVGVQIGVAIREMLPQVPSLFTNQVLPFINHCIESLKDFLGQYDPTIISEIDMWFSEVAASMSQTIATASATVIKLASNIAIGTPEMILKIVLTVVSTFFISMDFNNILGFIKKLVPSKHYTTISHIKEKAITSIAIFIRAYTLIFLLTFAELSIGFWLLRIPYAVGLGILVALVDLMPILGTGLVLLPWALVVAVTGNAFLAVGLIVLYVAITAIRNVVEPKLVGGKIGLHPLATLISMFVGLQLFGIMGLFLFPLILSLLVQLGQDGLLPHFSLQ